MRFFKEKGKRYIALLIVCVMMIGLFPVGVYAVPTVIEVNNSEGLINAFLNATTDGSITTIKLVASIDLTSDQIITNKNIILDLNGNNLTRSFAINMIALSGTASMEVKDTSSESSGTVTSNNVAIYNEGSGNINISSGAVISLNGIAIHSIGSGNINIFGGTVSSAPNHAIYNAGIGSVYISAGTVTSTNAASVSNTSVGVVNVSGGTVQSVHSRAIMSDGVVNVSGGELSGREFVGAINASVLNISGAPMLRVRLYDLARKKVDVTGLLTGNSGAIVLDGNLLENSVAGTVVATATNEAHADVLMFSLVNLDGRFLSKSGSDLILTKEITSFDTISNVNAGTEGNATYSDASEVIAALPTSATANAGEVTVPVTTWVDTDSYNTALEGSYTFTATLGSVPAGYTNTGNHTASVEVVVAAPVDPDIAIVDVAKITAEGANYMDMTQETATSEIVIENALKATAEIAINDSTVTIVVNKASYTEPIAGTSAEPDGIDGSYVFTVTVSKGVQYQTTDQKTIVITAIEFTDAVSKPITQLPGENSSDNSDEEPDSTTPSTTTSTTPLPTNTIVNVNGVPVSASTEMVTSAGGKVTTFVQVNNEVIQKKIDDAIKNNTNGNFNSIQIQIRDTNSEISIVELTGDIVKKLEENNFTVSVKNNDIEYIIPAKEFTISKVAETLNILETELKAIKVEVRITKQDEKTVEAYNEIAKANGAELLFPPVSFEVVAKTTKTDGSIEEVSISKFSNYVERVMEIPAGVMPSKITTGIVFNSDGTFSHVPTTVFQKDGKWYASLNSLTNSTYSIIWNSVAVATVENHWSKEDVNDMASRLIIKDPEMFMPDQNITRGEFAEYITKALGIYRNGSTYTQKFSDVEVTHVLADAIAIATDYGIVSGYPDGTFKPGDQISREEAMVMYSRAMDLTGLRGTDSDKINNYIDKDLVSGWAYDDVRKTVSAGVFNGKNKETINPKDTFTCAEAITAIRNLLLATRLINK